MHKKILTADEEMRGAAYCWFFSIIWYATLFQSILKGKFSATMILFLAAGLVVIVQAVRIMRRAFDYRKLHKEIIAHGRRMEGRIVNIVQKYRVNTDSDSARRYYTSFYFLTVEVVDPITGLTREITSDAYRIPLYRYLGRPEVLVYVDETGWKYVIDGFRLKERRSDPDVPLRESNVYVRNHNEQSNIIKLIFVIAVVFLLLRAVGILQ